MLQNIPVKKFTHYSVTRTLKKKTFHPVQQAVYAAYQCFQQTHPEWVASLFDETFLQKEAAGLFVNGRLPTSMQLATAWRDQFGFGTHRQRAAHIYSILPAVNEFLQMVCQELRQHGVAA